MDLTTQIKGVPEIMQMLQRVAGDIGPGASRALNRTANGVRTDMTKLATSILNVRSKDVRDGIKINGANPSNLKATVYRRGRPLSLYDYIGTRELEGRGVSIKVFKTGKRTILKHAFVATMKSGHEGVFWREWSGPRTTPKNKRLPWKKFSPHKGIDYRLKISERFGPGIENTLSKSENSVILKMQAMERLQKEARHELNRALKKRG